MQMGNAYSPLPSFTDQRGNTFDIFNALFYGAEAGEQFRNILFTTFPNA